MKSNLPQRFSCVCHRTFCIDVVSSVAELKIVFVFCLHRHRLKKSDAATPPPEYISLRPPITAPVSGGGDFTGLFGGGRFGVVALSEFRGSKFWRIWLCLLALGGSERRWRVADCPAAVDILAATSLDLATGNFGGRPFQRWRRRRVSAFAPGK